MSVHTCSHDGCGLPGPWRPVLHFWPSEGYICTDPVKIEVGLYLCLRHREQFKIGDFVNDHINMIATMAAKHSGKPPPDYRRTEIRWMPVAESVIEDRRGASS